MDSVEDRSFYLKDEPSEETITSNSPNDSLEIKIISENKIVQDTNGDYPENVEEIPPRNIDHLKTHESTMNFQCVICDSRFQNKDSLLQHFRSHDLQDVLGLCGRVNRGTVITITPQQTLPTKLMCKICSKTYKNIKLLKQHFSTHSPILCYTCHVCWINFPSSLFLEPHFMVHKTEEVLSIMYHTQQPSVEQRDVYRTLSTDLTVKGQLDGEWYYCNFCSTMVFDRTDNHLLKYHRHFLIDKAYKCFICGSHFKTAEDLKCHINNFLYRKNKHLLNVSSTSQNLNETRDVVKEISVMPPKSKSTMKKPIEKILGNDTEKEKKMKTKTKYQCNICKTISASAFLLNYHMKKYHDPCTCGLETCTKCNLKRKHNTKLQCTVCDKVFYSLLYLTKHMEKHSGTDRHECDKCDQVFKWPQTLEYHIQSKHAKSVCTCGEEMCEHCIKGLAKILRCSICQKEFKKRQGLLRHEKLHKGELELKQYCCEICGKIYTRHSSLHTHIQMVHKDPCRCGSCETCVLKNPKFQCNICKKIFISRHKLDRHTIIHSGERPHICEICGKAFNQAGNLFVHLKSHKRREQLS